MKAEEQFTALENLSLTHDVIAMENICHVDTGTSLYHYTSPDGLLGILQPNGKAKLWFTQYDSLNDYSERTDIIDYLHGYCNFQVKENRISGEFADAVKQLELVDDCRLTVPGKMPVIPGAWGNDEPESWTNCPISPCYTYLYCFSEEPDLLPMWNYYTKSQHYEGYSIGFLGSFFRNMMSFERGYSIELRHVLYSDQEKAKLLTKILLPLANIFLESNDDGKREVMELVQIFINKFQFVFKNICFQHEKEIRAILRVPKEPLEGGTTFERKYRNSNGYIVPYVEYLFPINMVTHITAAPLLQPTLASDNLRAMLKQYGYINVHIDSSKIPIRF